VLAAPRMATSQGRPDLPPRPDRQRPDTCSAQTRPSKHQRTRSTTASVAQACWASFFRRSIIQACGRRALAGLVLQASEFYPRRRTGPHTSHKRVWIKNRPLLTLRSRPVPQVSRPSARSLRQKLTMARTRRGRMFVQRQRATHSRYNMAARQPGLGAPAG